MQRPQFFYYQEDPCLLESVLHLLREDGYQFTICNEDDASQKALPKVEIRLIDGLALLRIARSTPPHDTLLVIILSRYDQSLFAA